MHQMIAALVAPDWSHARFPVQTLRIDHQIAHTRSRVSGGKLEEREQAWRAEAAVGEAAAMSAAVARKDEQIARLDARISELQVKVSVGLRAFFEVFLEHLSATKPTTALPVDFNIRP